MEAKIDERVRFNAVDIYDFPLADQQRLSLHYGKSIEEIRKLNVIEEMFLGKAPTMSLGLVHQSVYKLHSSRMLNPTTVLQQLRRFMLKNKLLRTSYFKGADGEHYGVQLDTSMIINTVSFHVLTYFTKADLWTKITGIIDADQRTQLNYGEQFIPRLSFYALDDGDYVVLVTQPVFFTSFWQPELFLATLLPEVDVSPLSLPEPINFHILSEGLREGGDEKAYAFWQNYLTNLPEPAALPGYTGSTAKSKGYSSFSWSINKNTVAELKGLNKSGSAAEWMALLSTAWAITMKNLCQQADLAFAVEPYEEKGDQGRLTENAVKHLHGLPCRFKLEKSAVISALCNEQCFFLEQMAAAAWPNLQEYQFFSKVPLPKFNLDFRGLFGNHDGLSANNETGANPTLLYTKVLDNRLDFSACFRFTDAGLNIDIMHNVFAIGAESMERILSCFAEVLRCLPQNYQSELSVLEQRIQPRYNKGLNRDQLQMLSKLLKKTDLFASVSGKVLIDIASKSYVYQLHKYDVVQTVGMQQQDVLLLMSGDVVRQKLTKDGWLSPLNIVHSGELINELAMFKEISKLNVEVVSDTAVIASIPAAMFKWLLGLQNDVGLQVIEKLATALDHYEDLWLTV